MDETKKVFPYHIIPTDLMKKWIQIKRINNIRRTASREMLPTMFKSSKSKVIIQWVTGRTLGPLKVIQN